MKVPKDAERWRGGTAVLAAALILMASTPAEARDASARRAFVRENPCPVTGQRGKCPGWVVDHVVPLCAGGPDKLGNMQWQTVEDAKIKDREERRQCNSKIQRTGI
jgi:hypothetical protein